ncbi:hypothetical protein C8046_08270 [Serinibacter arcticus]|uniref:Uncharacterized protein n=1 Tax=Serinibacter arcticus TaxID=1655435 RepID=A0A2U1ZUM5_9MICO|nr:hypothetical protein [Serinibacter arcticus]PWD50650.1 hypothetical protein C8046_08270 [Serinibacter arcticus]
MSDDNLRRFAPPGDDRDDDRNDDAQPGDQHDDDAAAAVEEKVMARLRAADPAAEVEVSPEFPTVVEARVDDDESADGTPSAADAAPTATDPDDAEPPAPVDLTARRRRSWYAPVAAAAAAVIVGTSGYALGGSAASGGSSAADSAESAPAPISLGGPQVAGGDAGAAEESAVGPAATSAAGPASADFASRSAADSMMIGFGRSTFSSTGLSTAERSAQAFGLDAATASTEERMVQLATALGMAGTPAIANGGWELTDGTRQLNVGLDGSLSSYFYDSAAQAWCEGCEEPRPEDAPSGDAAIERIKEVLTAIGEDPTQFEFTSPTWEGAVSAMAEARRVVAGQGTDLMFYLELTSTGLASFSGSLAGVVDLGTYPVVSEQEGVERLSDPRFGGYQTGWARTMEGDTSVTQEWTPPTEAPAAPAPGVSVAWPVQDVTITGARLGLAQQWQPDGTVLLVPSYEFTDADGGTWSVIAVADEQLDFSVQQ